MEIIKRNNCNNKIGIFVAQSAHEPISSFTLNSFKNYALTSQKQKPEGLVCDPGLHLPQTTDKQFQRLCNELKSDKNDVASIKMTNARTGEITKMQVYPGPPVYTYPEHPVMHKIYKRGRPSKTNLLQNCLNTTENITELFKYLYETS